MAIAGPLPFIFCIFPRAISWRQEIARNQNSNFYLEIRPGACCPVETEKPWGPDEHLPIYYKHPGKKGGRRVRYEFSRIWPSQVGRTGERSRSSGGSPSFARSRLTALISNLLASPFRRRNLITRHLPEQVNAEGRASTGKGASHSLHTRCPKALRISRTLIACDTALRLMPVCLAAAAGLIPPATSANASATPDFPSSMTGFTMTRRGKL